MKPPHISTSVTHYTLISIINNPPGMRTLLEEIRKKRLEWCIEIISYAINYQVKYGLLHWTWNKRFRTIEYKVCLRLLNIKVSSQTIIAGLIKTKSQPKALILTPYYRIGVFKKYLESNSIIKAKQVKPKSEPKGFHLLPSEMLFEIMSFANLKEQIICSTVNSSLNEMLKHKDTQYSKYTSLLNIGSIAVQKKRLTTYIVPQKAVLASIQYTIDKKPNGYRLDKEEHDSCNPPEPVLNYNLYAQRSEDTLDIVLYEPAKTTTIAQFEYAGYGSETFVCIGRNANWTVLGHYLTQNFSKDITIRKAEFHIFNAHNPQTLVIKQDYAQFKRNFIGIMMHTGPCWLCEDYLFIWTEKELKIWHLGLQKQISSLNLLSFFDESELDDSHQLNLPILDVSMEKGILKLTIKKIDEKHPTELTFKLDDYSLENLPSAQGLKISG